MGGSVEFIFPDCGNITKCLLELCRQNDIETFMFVIPDKVDKPRHVINFIGVPDQKTGKITVTVKIEKKKR